MKMLKHLFRFTWLRREARGSAVSPTLIIDPEEFARLIGSGRVEDLRLLAKKLSQQPRAHA